MILFCKCKILLPDNAAIIEYSIFFIRLQIISKVIHDKKLPKEKYLIETYYDLSISYCFFVIDIKNEQYVFFRHN